MFQASILGRGEHSLQTVKLQHLSLYADLQYDQSALPFNPICVGIPESKRNRGDKSDQRFVVRGQSVFQCPQLCLALLLQERLQQHVLDHAQMMSSASSLQIFSSAPSYS